MGRRTSSTLNAVQPQWDARVQASPEHIPFPYLFLATSLSSFMSLHSRISSPAPSFSCCPGFSNVAPGKLKENGSQWHSTNPPVSLSLPLLPVWAGLPRGSQAFEAEGREHSPSPPSWGMGQSPRELGGIEAKHLPQRWPMGKDCSTAIEGRKSKKKEMEDGGSQSSPAIHPPAFWYWIGLLPLAAARSLL